MDIENLTYEELTDLNARIVERLKFLDYIRTQTEMHDFRVGERVCFQVERRGLIEGTLIKHNRKTVTVVTDDGGRWNVSPSLLAKAGDTEVSSPQGGKIIDLDGERLA